MTSVEIKKNIPLAPHTIFKIGGVARFFTEIKNSDELKEALKFAARENAPFFILGAGSNILVSDNGFNGLVIKMAGGGIKIGGEKIFCDAGAMMPRVVSASANASLGGFEWGIGIPGTIGGSIRGNAGCFGGDMAQIVESVEALEIKNFKFRISKLTNKECGFSYRDSVFKKHPELVILSAVLKLKKSDFASIQEKIKSFTAIRSQTQDIGAKCAGCIFKNTPWNGMTRRKEKMIEKFPELKQFGNKENIPAGFLIDKSGLKGRRIGRALISSAHANYFINSGDAKAEEITELIFLAKKEVRKRYGIELEEEIQYLGF